VYGLLTGDKSGRPWIKFRHLVFKVVAFTAKKLIPVSVG